jgi:hypothetical protein
MAAARRNKTFNEFMSEDNEFWSFLTLASLGTAVGAVGGVLSGEGAGTGARVGAVGSTIFLLGIEALAMGRAAKVPSNG